jgi:hypothetical protein
MIYRNGLIGKWSREWGWDSTRMFDSTRMSVRTHLLFRRVRSDDEAIRLLCDKVDAYLDELARVNALVETRQQELRDRERAMQEVERGTR